MLKETSPLPADQVVHMDIKPAKILLEDSICRMARSADLGVSRYLVEASLDTITSCVMSSALRWPCAHACLGSRLNRKP